MITIDEYFSGGSVEKFGAKLSHPDATEERQTNARVLLYCANELLAYAKEHGVYGEWVDDDTGSQISGVQGGAGDGGFRLQKSATGTGKSKHKEGAALDVFDPQDKLDNWLTDETLFRFKLFREHPDATKGWCHLQTIPPGWWKEDSEKRTFIP